MGTDYSIEWLGWNNFDTSDKIWGYLRLADGRYFAFWGRRGKTLKFKNHGKDFNSVSKLQWSKANASKPEKKYHHVDAKDYDRLVKDFIVELEINCMTAILSDTVM